jgi:hypothetical protein
MVQILLLLAKRISNFDGHPYSPGHSSRKASSVSETDLSDTLIEVTPQCDINENVRLLPLAVDDVKNKDNKKRKALF